MTAPALTDAQLAQLRVLATAAALTYHNSTVPEGERVNVAESYAVHGDLRLVAADVLEAACLHASKAASGSSGGVKRIKIDGELEVEKFAATSADSVTAETWCARAARLRAEVKASGAGGGRLVASPLAGMRSGSRPVPVFRITPPPEDRT